MNRDVELSGVVVHSKGSSVESDNVSKSENDGKVFESLGIDDNRGMAAALGASIEARVDNFERADVELLVDLVREGGVSDDTIDMLGVGGSE